MYPAPQKGKGMTSLKQDLNMQSQFTDEFNKNEHNQVPLLSRTAPLMNDIVVSTEGSE